ncbi:MAG: YggS family pyridoxal phosphate-dependent enzyme [Candidatus Cloacimonadota bacterium]|nr:MAG: YggS family pyridoxal phosphate-dependent enzyme [Candidatus Cloacimonadota bacterium]
MKEIIAENLKIVWEKIAAAAEKSGRSPENIKLVAVTKTHSPEKVDLALKNGVKFIGENRVQEAEKKLPLLKEKYEEFHFIGHLQTNKISKLMKLNPVLIHSIERFSTAKKLNEFLQKENRLQNILIEVNNSAEESKFGVAPSETIDFVKQVAEFSHLKILGLMTVGMFTQEEQIIRKCFRTLKTLFEKIKEENIRNVEMKYLSMGMSNDFEIAIEEGANIIRLGTAIFGTREHWEK